MKIDSDALQEANTSTPVFTFPKSTHSGVPEVLNRLTRSVFEQLGKVTTINLDDDR